MRSEGGKRCPAPPIPMSCDRESPPQARLVPALGVQRGGVPQRQDPRSERSAARLRTDIAHWDES
jgi:hypothetical protein